MTAEACREWRECLGALALERLSEEERRSTEAHLERCAACRAEAESLRPLPGLLALADPMRISEPASAPPPGLADRIAKQIAAERRAGTRKRRFRFGFGFAGAAAAAAAAAVVLVVLLGPGTQSESQRIAFRNVPAGVRIAATLQPHAWGTEVRMNVSGIRSGTLCRVFLRSGAGRPEPAGSFRYRYSDEHGQEVLGSALDVSSVSAVEVRAGGRTFVQPLGSHVTASS